MKYVVDSSVLIKTSLPEQESDRAILLRDDFIRNVHELIAPDVCAVEIAHALTRAERQGRIPPGQSLIHLIDQMRILPRLYSSVPLLPQATDVSSQMRVGVYDCLYAVLADQEHCEFVTADARLLNVLQGRFPSIRSLASLP
jgi:predicted nucleic acid-binding protein